MSKKPLAETNRRVFEALWVLLIFALFYVVASSALMVLTAAYDKCAAVNTSLSVLIVAGVEPVQLG